MYTYMYFDTKQTKEKNDRIPNLSCLLLHVIDGILR